MSREGLDQKVQDFRPEVLVLQKYWEPVQGVCMKELRVPVLHDERERVSPPYQGSETWKQGRQAKCMSVPVALVRKLGPQPVLMTGLPTDGRAGLVELCCPRILYPDFAMAADHWVVGFICLVLDLLRGGQPVRHESRYPWRLISLHVVSHPAKLPTDRVVIEVVVLKSPIWDFCFGYVERVFPRGGEP